MKKLFSLLLGIAVAVSASAQYVCTKQGSVFNYSKTVYDDNKKTEFTDKLTVSKVSTGADGLVTVEMTEDVMETNNRLNSATNKSTATYNPADTTTVYNMGDAESTIDELIESVRQEAAQAGHSLSQADLDKIRGSIKAKGELLLKVNPNYAAGAKQPNQTLRIDLGMMGKITTNLWEIKCEGSETIEVPAGKFDCIKMSCVLRQSAMNKTDKIYQTIWYAEGIGEVKSTAADKKGNILGEQILLSYALAE